MAPSRASWTTPSSNSNGEAERAKLKRLVGELPTFEITPEVWTRAFELAQASRKRGLTIPATDLVIAATAAYHGLALFHADRHFELLSGIGEA